MTSLDRRIETARNWYERVRATKGAKAAEKYRVRLTTLLLKRANAGR